VFISVQHINTVCTLTGYFASETVHWGDSNHTLKSTVYTEVGSLSRVQA